MSKYMGQIMAECDCQHQACEMRGYCMAARIEELEANAMANRVAIMRLEAKLAKAREEGFWAGRSCGGAKKEIDAALEELKGQDDE